MIEYISQFEDCPFVYVRWKDNKHVSLLSTFVGTQPTLTAKRYNRNTKKHEDVPVPRVINQYNIHTGGVDLMDSVIGKSRIIMRTKKCYMRIFYHLLDFSVANSWFLRNKIHLTEKSTMIDFRIQFGTTLCKLGTPTTATRRIGRPSTSIAPSPRRLPLSAPRITEDIRFDELS